MCLGQLKFFGNLMFLWTSDVPVRQSKALPIYGLIWNLLEFFSSKLFIYKLIWSFLESLTLDSLM